MLLPTSTGLGEADLLIARSAALPVVQQLPPSLITTPSMNQPLPPPLASVTQRQRSCTFWPAAAAGRSTVVVIQPPELPDHAARFLRLLLSAFVLMTSE